MAQLAERMVPIAREDAPGETLEGIFRSGGGGERGAAQAPGGAVVAPPHPLYGGSLDSPVVNEIAWAASRAGLATLAFNWRGVGASAGEPSAEPGHADADYAAALAHLAETVSGPLVACGYSFCAAAAVRATRTSERVKRLVLVAPPAAWIQAAELRRCQCPALVVVGACDRLAPAQELAAQLAEVPALELRVIEAADHFFSVGLAEVGGAITRWLSE